MNKETKFDELNENSDELMLAFRCPMESSLAIIGGKWKVGIIYCLFSGPKRYSDIRRMMPFVSQRMLSRQLKELEVDELLTRTVYPESPPKVEYQLTSLARSLKPLLNILHDWL